NADRRTRRDRIDARAKTFGPIPSQLASLGVGAEPRELIARIHADGADRSFFESVSGVDGEALDDRPFGETHRPFAFEHFGARVEMGLPDLRDREVTADLDRHFVTAHRKRHARAPELPRRSSLENADSFDTLKSTLGGIGEASGPIVPHRLGLDPRLGV